MRKSGDPVTASSSRRTTATCAPSGEAAANVEAIGACSASPRGGQQAPVPRDSTTEQIVGRPRRAGAAPARRRAYRQHSARLLRSRRGGDLRAGRRSARDSYRTYGATRTPERECPRQHEWAGLPAGRSKRLRIRQDHCHRAIAVGGVVRTHAGGSMRTAARSERAVDRELSPGFTNRRLHRPPR